MAEERRKEGSERIAVLETKFDLHAKQMSEVVGSIDKIDKKLDNVLDAMAEARGAGKVAKLVLTGLASLAGFAGGMVSNIAKHM